MADIVGKEKILNYIGRYKVRKIKLTKGADVVYLHSIKPDENQSDLVDDFSDWMNDFIEENNFQQYKLELFGTNNPDPNAKLSPVVKIGIQFNAKDYASPIRDNNIKSEKVDVERYIGLAVENAELKAKLDSMESKLDDVLNGIDDDDAPQSTMDSVKDVLLSKLDGIVDVLIHQFGSRNQMAPPPISGHGEPVHMDENSTSDVNEDLLNFIEQFETVHPEILDDLKRLYNIKMTNPSMFNMLVKSLRNF
jgi:hypothetical protein